MSDLGGNTFPPPFKAISGTFSRRKIVDSPLQLTAEQIRIVLNRMSISITQDQMSEVLERLGFSTNLLVDYSLFVEYFSNRSNSGLVHTILSDPNLK